MGQQDFLGTGFHFPVEPDYATGRLKEVSGEHDIVQAIQLILCTKKGERIMRPEFGCDIHKFVFETMTYSNLRMMERTVREGLIRWEPRIQNIRVEVGGNQNMDGAINISIHYVVRSTNNPYSLVYPFYLNEGIKM